MNFGAQGLRVLLSPLLTFPDADGDVAVSDLRSPSVLTGLWGEILAPYGVQAMVVVHGTLLTEIVFCLLHICSAWDPGFILFLGLRSGSSACTWWVLGSV